MMRDFLWEGSGKGKRDHLVRWEIVSRPKSQGGLALGNIVKRNIDLTGKWLWRFALERDSLWYAIIKSKYGLQANGWDAQTSSRISARSPWKFTSQGLDRFLEFTSLSVGKGDRVRFWEDHWRGDASFCSLFPRLYRLSLAHNASISSMVSIESQSFRWDFKFFRNLNERESSNLASLLNILEGFSLSLFIPVKRVWIADSSGVFSCKSYFEKLIGSSHILSCFPSDLIWKARVPLKVKVFAWTVFYKGINTNDKFQGGGHFFLHAHSGASCIGRQLKLLIIYFYIVRGLYVMAEAV
ncbi:hypothetical protein L1049_027285 [Liquidambar formosana]|uniref:Reverse transcriptase zinc-binding domain-containing protein n=1 Tax=Liquidambar formosana TaxID=63359 RepID=A0AAP0R3D3_LIQFO